MTPEKLAEWREDAELRANRADSHLVFANRIIALIGTLEDMATARDAHFEARNRLSEKVDWLEARLARSVSWSEVIRALREADVPEDSMATDDDLLRYEGRAEAVNIMRDMLDV